MKYNCTGVILAGGSNTRMPGIQKSFHKIKGKKIMDFIHQLFSCIFNEVIIVTNNPLDFAAWDAMIVTDIYPFRCSLAGIHAGLFYSSNNKIFVSACDTPFLKKELIEYILSQKKKEFDVVIPETNDGLEPLCAVYSNKCIPRIEKNLNNKIFMIKKFFKKNRVKKIPVNQIQKIDPNMKSFFNINTYKDLQKARIMMAL